MTGRPDNESTLRLLDELSDLVVPEWTEPADLSRFSLETFSARGTFEAPRSFGSLRLFGDAVHGHAASLDLVGAVCQQFQRVVVSTGAALEGVRTTRGKISESIQKRARLTLNASPAPGSLILALTPSFDPSQELHDPKSPSILQDDPEPLADRSVKSVLDALSQVGRVDVAQNEALSGALAQLGPRAVQALRSLAKTLAEDGCDFDLGWSQPNHPTRRVRLTSSQAAWLNDFVGESGLDESEVRLVGTLRTISNRRAIELETVADGIVYLQPGEVAPAVLADLHLDQMVTVRALETVEVKVGGGESRSFTMLDVEPAYPSAR